MSRHLPWHHPRRAGCTALVWALMAQMVVPAHAYVSQMPAAFTPPPDPNVMFTLDDSLSMHSDAIPDYLTTDSAGNNVDLSGMPNDEGSNSVAPEIPNVGRQFPGMWREGSDYLDARYYSANGTTNANVAGRYMRSSDGNPLYYNPKVLYKPWPDPSNNTLTLPQADPEKVNIHPSDPTNTGRQINLKRRMGTGNDETPFWPATYFVKTSAAPLPLARPDTRSVNGVDVTYTRYEIKPTSNAPFGGAVMAYPKGADRTDCSGAIGPTGCTYDQEVQNFANWLQYYRSRMLMAKGGVALAFAKQGAALRVGFGTINNTVQRGVRKFTGNDRKAFFDTLYPVPRATTGTPLREAMDKVGKYFQRSDAGNPWAEDPSSSSVGNEYACRRSFHMLSTDGFWNGNSASAPANGNHDNFSGNTPAMPDGTTFTYSNATTSSFGIAPFSDNISNTLADVAAYYWKTDLRDTLANRVPSTSSDPAFWQHLTTFTVGLGVAGTGLVTKTTGGVADIATQEGRNQLINSKTPLNWTTPSANSSRTGDDLIHAAMNGRGRYLQGNNPTQLAANVSTALADAVDTQGDVASLAVESQLVRTNSEVYQATFSPAGWYGRLYAFTQDASTGAVNNKPTDGSYTNPTQLWEASNKMPPPAQRNIFTSSGGSSTGATFTWDNLTPGQKTNLGNDSNVLTYLRGDASKEVANGGTFRNRPRYTVGATTGGVLGDVVNGSPLKGPEGGGGYDRLPTTASSGQATYKTFRSNAGPLDAMRKTIFVAANDGMLHAFDTTDGVERFAYVPSTVYNVPRSSTSGADEKKLLMLADPAYSHRFTVDGPPNVADAYIDSAWRTMLVGSTGAGARGIFAMDVTRPVVGPSGFGAGKIMWEFSDANSADMGHVLAYPHVVRMRNEKWAVIWGNGVDSETGRAVLYIRDAKDGSVIKDFVVGPTGGNGLSQPNFILNKEREVIAIYAGDLKGNLWKFDVSGTSATSWAPAFGSEPFFTATGPAGTVQPITVMPEISAHPDGGAMLIFGTGKLYEPSDTALPAVPPATDTNVNLNPQSIYGVWDKPYETSPVGMTASNRNTLLKPQAVSVALDGELNIAFRRTSTDKPAYATQRGWFYDLESGGERSNLSPQQVRNVVFIATNKPTTSDPCASSGSSKVFALDPVNGGSPAFPVFDVDRDGRFESNEKGLNVLLNGSALLTQPVFQVFATGGSTSPPELSVQPLSPFDRGQATAARSGGVELTRTGGGTGTAIDSNGATIDPCKAAMSAAQSNTNLLQQLVNVCPTKSRISWRQLK